MKIKKYAEHYESGEWELTGSAYSEIIIVCTPDEAEQRLRKKLLAGAMNDLIVYTCTIFPRLESGGESSSFSTL